LVDPRQFGRGDATKWRCQGSWGFSLIVDLMNYWIFTVTPHQGGSEAYSAREIYQRRMQDRFWGLGERTPNRRNIRCGDAIVFYVGRPESVFAGTAQLASESFVPSDEDRPRLSHGSAFFTPQYGVNLDGIETWSSPRSVVALAPNLKFIANPVQWWAYLQGGIRQISEEDFHTIVADATSPITATQTPEGIASQSLFAIEAHLEDFIDHNWAKIA
jgi:EVE domain